MISFHCTQGTSFTIEPDFRGQKIRLKPKEFRPDLKPMMCSVGAVFDQRRGGWWVWFDDIERLLISLGLSMQQIDLILSDLRVEKSAARTRHGRC